ncbi:hypothetical protein BB561_002434 [Smittium simulii]|uniref:Uncharacterized protein n=1 Tax=Smittium simulii TaxID=133385 RepID=A0A2T9YQH8_9FUNG|nr:hypothetical protein BB561_002434 [Smittium simulii]
MGAKKPDSQMTGKTPIKKDMVKINDQSCNSNQIAENDEIFAKVTDSRIIKKNDNESKSNKKKLELRRKFISDALNLESCSDIILNASKLIFDSGNTINIELIDQLTINSINMKLVFSGYGYIEYRAKKFIKKIAILEPQLLEIQEFKEK